FPQRRRAVTMWGWCAILAGAALATRFIHPHAHGDWHTGPTIAVALIGAAALAASIYMVYLLEIVKLANPPIPRGREVAPRPRPPPHRVTHADLVDAGGGVHAAIAKPDRLAVGNAAIVDLGAGTVVVETHISFAARRGLG